MKKSIWIFLLAVLLPSIVLGWLALRSAEEQQIILEKRTAELYQKETENAAGAVRALVDGERRAFTEAVGQVLATRNPQQASLDFPAALAKAWPRKAVGFALGKDGRLISPSAQKARNNAELQKFLLENSAFLCSTMPATVYWVSGDDLNKPDVLRRKVASDSQLSLKNTIESPQQIAQAGQTAQTAQTAQIVQGVQGGRVSNQFDLWPTTGALRGTESQQQIVLPGNVSMNAPISDALSVYSEAVPKSASKEFTIAGGTNNDETRMTKDEIAPLGAVKLASGVVLPKTGAAALGGGTAATIPPSATASMETTALTGSIVTTVNGGGVVANASATPGLLAAPKLDVPAAPAPAPAAEPEGAAAPLDTKAAAVPAPAAAPAPVAPVARRSGATAAAPASAAAATSPPAQLADAAVPVAGKAIQTRAKTLPQAKAKEEVTASANAPAPGDKAFPMSGKGTLTLSGPNTFEGATIIDGKLSNDKDATEKKVAERLGKSMKVADLAKAQQSPANPVQLQTSQTAQTNDTFANNGNRYGGQIEQGSLVRNVAPQRMPDGDNGAVLSQLTPSTAEFKTLTSEGREGVITRFVQDQLDIIFWVRPAQDPDMIFGCLIESENLADLWPAALPEPQPSSYRDRISRGGGSEFSLALLDDKARPVATQPAGLSGRDWKRPFVASEVGEALPHWEAALYLQRPEQLHESAVSLRRMLTMLIATALGAIACGGWLVVADARRQLALAQQKTDFVSNVSHELKTPLTSIRMFAELMQNGRTETAGKHPQYLRIIMVEAERLTRLINNVLDFARLERRQKRFDKKPLDLHAVIERAWEGHELHLRESGFTTRWQAAPPPYPVIGDEDALAQILVNLLSNAEKYAGEHKEVELHTYIDGARICVSVLDRGLGVPPGEERKIFEAFYRAHDSLSSGIQGSGLGLTLAQRLAREHGGEILYQAREGGGSNFTLRLPVAPNSPADTTSL